MACSARLDPEVAQGVEPAARFEEVGSLHSGSKTERAHWLRSQSKTSRIVSEAWLRALPRRPDGLEGLARED